MLLKLIILNIMILCCSAQQQYRPIQNIGNLPSASYSVSWVTNQNQWQGNDNNNDDDNEQWNRNNNNNNYNNNVQWNNQQPAASVPVQHYNTVPSNNIITGPAAPRDSSGAHRFPAGVDPASCPNFPYCNTGNYAGASIAPLPGWSERQYPSGVSAQECPNFPYCN